MEFFDVMLRREESKATQKMFGGAMQQIPEHDDKGYLVCRAGDLLELRYELQEFISIGRFTSVVDARDLQEHRYKTLKIYRRHYRERAGNEINILKAIVRAGRNRRHLCAVLLDNFLHNGHVCLIFERYGITLQQHVLRLQPNPLPMQHVRHIVYQLVCALRFLHDNGIIHGAVQPDNIVFSGKRNIDIRGNIRDSSIRLIDFSSACFDAQSEGFPYLRESLYRAPEFALDLPWGQSSDIWSVGVILAELACGRALFTRCLPELTGLQSVLGPVPAELVQKLAPNHSYFKWVKSADGEQVPSNAEFFMDLPKDDEDYKAISDLVQNTLTYMPEKRLTAAKVLQHEFFKNLGLKVKPKSEEPSNNLNLFY